MKDLELTTRHEAGILNALTSKRRDERKRILRNQLIAGGILLIIELIILFR